MTTSRKFLKLTSYKSLFLSVGVIGLLSTQPALAQDSLEGLSDLPDGAFNSQAFAVSADGSTVVGFGRPASGASAFRWTSGGGIVDLGDLPGSGIDSQAFGVSSNGSVVVGRGRSTNGNEAFRWTSAGGMVALGDLAGGTYDSRALGVSDDGNVVVGSAGSANGTEAFRWTSAGGLVGLGDLAGSFFQSAAYDTNSDGSIVVGGSTSSNGEEAFRWTSGGGMVGLGFLAGGTSISRANAISSDGSVIVGRSGSSNGTEAFRWNATDGMQIIGDLAGGAYASEAFDVSADGSVIVGESTSAVGTEAFRWTQDSGIETVEDWLAAAGVTTTGFTQLTTAAGVSADGSVIVGTGVSANGTEAFLARVAPVGSGVVNSASFTQTLTENVTIANLSNQSFSLSLNGAHHRPLMLDHNKSSNYGGWVTADGAYNDDGEREGYLANQEAGVYGDFLANKLRLGVGFGISNSRQDTAQGGDQDISGEYGVFEANYRPSPSSSLILGIIGLYGTWDADVERGYLNGGAQDSSNGETDIESGAIKASVFWQDAARIRSNRFGTITFSPKAAFTVTRTEVDGYTETGGGFPVQFDDITTTSQEARLGFEAAGKVNRDKTEIRVTAEAVHKFDSNSSGVSGDVVGLFSFDLRNESDNDTWVRVGLDVDHTFNNGITLGGSSFLSSTGADPDVSGAITLKVPF